MANYVKNDNTNCKCQQ